MYRTVLSVLSCPVVLLRIEAPTCAVRSGQYDVLSDTWVRRSAKVSATRGSDWKYESHHRPRQFLDNFSPPSVLHEDFANAHTTRIDNNADQHDNAVYEDYHGTCQLAVVS